MIPTDAEMVDNLRFALRVYVEQYAVLRPTDDTLLTTIEEQDAAGELWGGIGALCFILSGPDAAMMQALRARLVERERGRQ